LRPNRSLAGRIATAEACATCVTTNVKCRRYGGDAKQPAAFAGLPMIVAGRAGMLVARAGRVIVTVAHRPHGVMIVGQAMRRRANPRSCKGGTGATPQNA